MVLDTLKSLSQYEVIGYLDDSGDLQAKTINGLSVLGTISQLKDLVSQKKIEGAIIGVGNTDMKARDAIFKKTKQIGINLINVINPSSIISQSCSIEEGVFIGPKAIIGPGSVMGKNGVVYAGAIIEHDNKIEDNVYISPGVILSGKVTVKKDTFIGSGAVVIPGLTLGSNVTIGAGAVVIENIPDNVVAVGVPAKVIKTKN